MSIGKLVIVFFTSLIVNFVLASLGYGFGCQIIVSMAIGASFALLDTVTAEKKK